MLQAAMILMILITTGKKIIQEEDFINLKQKKSLWN